MTLVNAVTKTLSLCSCDFLLLDERILLGTNYIIDIETKIQGTLICGGCKERTQVTLVKANQQLHKYLPMNYLPLELFEVKGLA
jgi:hypothetical protein